MAALEKTTYQRIHPAFSWQGKSLKKAELIALANNYCHAKEPYLQDIGRFFTAWFDEHPDIEVQTSGSTGKPKRMRVKKQYMVNSALATGDFFNLPAGTTALLCLPATYIAGKLMLVRALVLGWQIDSVKPQARPLAVNLTAYDFCAMTPYQLDHSLKHLHLAKKIMVGGGAVSPVLYSRLQGHSTKVFETYAMTETLTHIAARRINAPSKAGKKPPFQLLKHVEISQDKRNCLVIKAPKVTDDIIYTNDIVALESKTTFWLKGRYDNVINTGGVKIHPEEVENKLAPLLTQRFFITGLPDDSLGEKIVLFIEDEYSEPKLNTIQAAITQEKGFDRYERPKEIYFVPQFTETHSGKINRYKTIALKRG